MDLERGGQMATTLVLKNDVGLTAEVVIDQRELSKVVGLVKSDSGASAPAGDTVSSQPAAPPAPAAPHTDGAEVRVLQQPPPRTESLEDPFGDMDEEAGIEVDDAPDWESYNHEPSMPGEGGVGQL